MAPQKYNARDCEFEIEDRDNPGTWVAIGGSSRCINTFTRSISYETTPTTTFGSQGRGESEVMEEGKTLVLEGFRLKDPTTGALDPGQAMVETQAARLGNESLTGFRFAAPGDTTWEVWAEAHFQLGDSGGANNDKVSWSVTVTRSGDSTTAVKA